MWADSSRDLYMSSHLTMPQPKWSKHDQGLGDELTAVHLSTVLVHDKCAIPQRSLVPKESTSRSE